MLSHPESYSSQLPPHLPDTALRILTCIEKCYRAHQSMPSFREMAEAAHITSKGHVFYLLNFLETAGYIRRENERQARDITLLRFCDGTPVASQEAQQPFLLMVLVATLVEVETLRTSFVEVKKACQ